MATRLSVIAPDFDREEARGRMLKYTWPMLGLHEVAHICGVLRQAVWTWGRKGKMPAPDASLSCGPVWHKATIARWIVEEG